MPAEERRTKGYAPQYDFERGSSEWEKQRFNIGDKGETHVASMLGASIEVKTDEAAAKYGNFYFETYSMTSKGAWKKSGIYGTEADVWVHLVKPGAAALFVPVKMVRELAEKYGKVRETKGVKFPTMGLVVNADLFIRKAMFGDD